MLTYRNRGFTLIEFMVMFAVLGILLAFGLPQYSLWMQNMRIRSAAESVQNGLQTARATAISRNSTAHLVFAPASLSYFVFTVPVPGNSPADFQDPDASPGTVDMIRRHNQADDSATANVAMLPADAYMVTFSALGQIVANPDGSNQLQQVDIASPTHADARPLRVVINAGGATRACDPSPALAADDPRRC